jgi:nicotinate-nucleotide pyrophosphorylase (carboxylating)
VTLPDIAAHADIRDIVSRALNEDIGPGDVTSEIVVGDAETAAAAVVARQDCVVAGLPVAALAFHTVDPSLGCRFDAADGRRARAGSRVMEVSGHARSILAAERVALNFLQRLSGIATLTHEFVERVSRLGVKVLDTRKTTPTLRALERYAVVCGGGTNHRDGLFDRVLVKDNHRVLWRRTAGRTLADAVLAARRARPGLEIEVEVESVEEFTSVLAARPDWILLDNMAVDAIAECVKLCAGRCKIEASGGITLQNAGDVAAAGVTAISVGALTHSAPAVDFSLELIP